MRAVRVWTVVALLVLRKTAEAGIAGFHKWFAGRFSEAVTTTHRGSKDTFDHVAFDMNQILHVVLRRSRNEGMAVAGIFKEVEMLLWQCAPVKSVIFAFDGSAPLAKMMLQRKRRQEGVKSSQESGMDTLQISPGTEFLEMLADAMTYYAYTRCQEPRFSGVKFYVSGANVSGEGELKCIDWVKRTCEAGTDESTVLIGGDADMVLQGMALKQVKNLFVYNQVRRGRGVTSSLWEVVRTLDEMFPGQSEYVRNDLMLLMALNGNDYLPKVRGFSFQKSFSAYVHVKQQSRPDSFLLHGSKRTFNWDFLVDFFSAMAHDQFVFDAEVQEREKKYPSAVVVLNNAVAQGKLPSRDIVEIRIERDAGTSVDTPAAAISKPTMWQSSVSICGADYSWTIAAQDKKEAKLKTAAMLLGMFLPDEYEEFLKRGEARREEDMHRGGDGDASANVDEQDGELWSVERYLMGMLWNLQMYVDGYTPDFYWQYGHPYAPSCREIVAWVEANPNSLARITPPVSPAPPMPSGVACLCLMPLNNTGKQYLPGRLKRLVEPGNPVRDALADMGRRSRVNLRKLLDAIHSEAPTELRELAAGVFASRVRKTWTVICHDVSEDTTHGDGRGTPPPPPPPPPGFPSLHPNSRVTMSTMAGTGSSPCYSWADPSEPHSCQQPQFVRDESYKRAFNVSRRRARQARQRDGSRGSHKSTRSVAQREKNKAPEMWRAATNKEAMSESEGRKSPDGESTEYPTSRSTTTSARATANAPPRWAWRIPSSSLRCSRVVAGRGSNCRVRV